MAEQDADAKVSADELTRKHKKLNSQLSAYKSAAASQYRDDRNDLITEWEEFETDSHWGSYASTDRPSIPLTLNVRQAQVSKVFDRPVKLAVVPQENSNFPIDAGHPFRQMLAQNAGSLEGVNPQDPTQNQKSDNEYHAQFLNALLQREWETGNIPHFLYRAGDLAAFAGECATVVGRDPYRVLRGESAIFLDLVNPKRLIKDPDATGIEDTRFWAYEVDRTGGYVEDVYGVDEDELKGNVEDDTHGREDGGKGRNKLVTLEIWYVRDEGMEDIVEEDGTENEVPMFRYGWKRVVRCGNKIIAEPEDAGRLPFSWLPWLRVPGKLAGQGVLDLFRSMNFQIDTSMFYLQENAKTTGQNFIFVDQTAFVGQEDKLNNLPGKIVPATSTNGDIKQSVLAVQGLEVSGAHINNINLNRELIDSISQVVDIRNGDNLPKDASGEFLKEAKGSGALRLAQIRDQEVIRVAKEIARCILDYVLDDDQPVTVKLPGIGEPQYATIVPSALRFDDQEFEAKFDIVADGSAAEPHDPMERDMFYARIIAELSQMPQQLADLRINLSDWTRKEEIRKSLQDFWQAQADQAANANAAGDPQEAAKVRGQVAKDTSQALQNVVGAIAKIDPVIALKLALAIPDMIQAVMSGQPIPDLSPLLNELAAKSAMTEALTPAPAPQVTTAEQAPMSGAPAEGVQQYGQ